MAEKTKGTLVSWRPDIKVLDCTLRDGGLVNNFRFADEFVKALFDSEEIREESSPEPLAAPEPEKEDAAAAEEDETDPWAFFASMQDAKNGR